MPKQFVRLAGDPILLRTLRALGAARSIGWSSSRTRRWIDETRELVEAASLRDAGQRRRGRRDPQREHPQRPRGPRRAPTTTSWSSTTRCGRSSRWTSSSARSSRSVAGRADAHRHRDPERGHARDRRGRRASSRSPSGAGTAAARRPRRSGSASSPAPTHRRRAPATCRRPTTAAWSCGTCRAPGSWRSRATR